MRIGIDGRLWNESGVGRYIRNLVQQLQLIDKSNEYILFVGSDVYKELKIQHSKFRNWSLVETNVRWHSIDEQIKMPRILNSQNLDLVHFPYFSIPLNYRKPYIVTLHDLIIAKFSTGKASTLPYPFYWIKRLAYKFLILQAVKKAKKIIVPTNAVKKDVVRFLGVSETKIAVTYEGSFNIREKVVTKNPLPSHIKNYLLYVGNAYPHKNLERTLEAFQRVRNYTNSKDKLNLVLVGKEDYFYKKLKKKVEEMEIKDSVFFAGFLDDIALKALYKQAKALIMPSLEEGFSLTPLEAMSFDCLTLVSDIEVQDSFLQF